MQVEARSEIPLYLVRCPRCGIVACYRHAGEATAAVVEVAPKGIVMIVKGQYGTLVGYGQFDHACEPHGQERETPDGVRGAL